MIWKCKKTSFVAGRESKGSLVRSKGLKMEICLDACRSEKRLSTVGAMVDSWRRVSGEMELGI